MTTPPYEPEGIHNFRSVAPYPVAGGGHFRAHAIYRSGALERMSAADAAWLRDAIGVQTVIDLRHPDELAGNSQDHGLADRVVPISIFAESQAQADVTAELNGLYGAGITGGRYLHYLQMAGERFAKAFRLFAEAPSYPVLVHCTAGKDRTGVLLALVMDVVGVSDEDIAAEYGLSDNSIDALLEYLRATGRVLEGTDAEIRARMATPPEKMAEFMRLLRAKYGTAANYLQGQGVTPAEIAAVRAHLLDPA